MLQAIIKDNFLQKNAIPLSLQLATAVSSRLLKWPAIWHITFIVWVDTCNNNIIIQHSTLRSVSGVLPHTIDMRHSFHKQLNCRQQLIRIHGHLYE